MRTAAREVSYWFKMINERTLCGFFSQRSVGTWGLTGLDRLLCFMIVQELQNIIIYLARNVFQDKAMMDVLSKFTKEMQPLKTIIGACA